MPDRRSMGIEPGKVIMKSIAKRVLLMAAIGVIAVASMTSASAQPYYYHHGYYYRHPGYYGYHRNYYGYYYGRPYGYWGYNNGVRIWITP